VNTSLGRGYGGDPYYVSVQGGYLFTGLELPATFQTSFQGGLAREFYQFDLAGRLGLITHIWIGLTFVNMPVNSASSGQNVLVFLGYNGIPGILHIVRTLT